MIEYIERNSEMYNTLAWMGLLSTEDRRIRYSRENDTTAYEDLDLTYDDIERTSDAMNFFAFDISAALNGSTITKVSISANENASSDDLGVTKRYDYDYNFN